MSKNSFTKIAGEWEYAEAPVPVPEVKEESKELDGDQLLETIPMGEENVELTEILKEASEKIVNEQVDEADVNSRFSTRGEITFDIDDTPLQPTPIVMLSAKKFNAAYLKQLESLIYIKEDSHAHSKLFTLMQLYYVLRSKKCTIKLTSNKVAKYVPKINEVANTFFKENNSVISSIYTMLNS